MVNIERMTKMKWRVDRETAIGADGNQGVEFETVAAFTTKADAQRFADNQPDTNGWVRYRVYGLRKLVVELITDSETPVWSLQDDLEQEIGCCSNSFTIKSVTEVEFEDDES